MSESERPLEKICNGVAEFRLLPSPGLWEFAFIRDPDDVLEKTEGYEKGRSEDSAGLRTAVNEGNGKLTMEFRTIILEKLN